MSIKRNAGLATVLSLSLLCVNREPAHTQFEPEEISITIDAFDKTKTFWHNRGIAMDSVHLVLLDEEDVTECSPGHTVKGDVRAGLYCGSVNKVVLSQADMKWLRTSSDEKSAIRFVIAHEMGHAVTDVLVESGDLHNLNASQGVSPLVLEGAADCLAGTAIMAMYPESVQNAEKFASTLESDLRTHPVGFSRASYFHSGASGQDCQGWFRPYQ